MRIPKHAEEQMQIREISLTVVESTILRPLSIIVEADKKVYQSITNFNGRNYLVRVFVNVLEQPNVVITVYKTSKIE